MLIPDLTADEIGPISKSGFDGWKTQFRTGLAEPDETKLPELISNARKAIVQRTEELSSQQDHQQEKTELWEALNSLQALQGVMRNRSR